MKTAVCLLTLLIAPSFAGSITPAERDRAVSELHATRKEFLDETGGLSNAQWNFKPSASAWSVAQIAEHIALSEDMLFHLVTRKIMQSPAQPEKMAAAKGRDEEVIRILTDRSVRAQAPPELVPHQRWSRDELIQHFKQSRDGTIQYTLTTQDDLRSHFADHPAAKTIDAYQWILLIAAHSQRHIDQMREVKSNPNFPER